MMKHPNQTPWEGVRLPVATALALLSLPLGALFAAPGPAGRKGASRPAPALRAPSTPAVKRVPAGSAHAQAGHTTQAAGRAIGHTQERVPAPPLTDEDKDLQNPGMDPVLPKGAFVPAPGTTAPTGFRAGRPAPRTAADSVQVLRNVPIGSGTGGHPSSSAEPSLAMNGDTVFYTANWFAAVSTDGGVSFRYINPYTFFPAADTEFCCDQVVQYIPQVDRFVWVLQYMENGSHENRYRIAVASSAGVATDQWTYYDITSRDAGLTNLWMDFPDLVFSYGAAYLTFNVYNGSDQWAGSEMVRITLNDLAGGGASLPFLYVQSATNFNFRAAQHCGSTLYWASFNSTSQIRVYYWNEWDTTYSYNDINVESFSTTPSSTTPDGFNWLNRAQSRILGATMAGGTLWFAWNAGAGGASGRPRAFVEVAHIDPVQMILIDQPDIWNPDFAFAYPALGTNSNEEVGISLCDGGPTFYPSHVVAMYDGSSWGVLATTALGTNGPSDQRWGDYLSVRPAYPYADKLVTGGFTLQGGTGNANSAPRFVMFGRSAVAPDSFETDDSAAAATTISTDGTPQNHSLHWDGDTDWAKFTLPQRSWVTLATDGASTTDDTVLDLYAAGDTTTAVATDDDGNHNLYSRIERSLDPGTYFVRVRDYHSYGYLIGAYTLQVTASPEDSYEPDDDLDHASTVGASGTVQHHTLHSEMDLDYAKFTANAGDQLGVSLQNLGAGASPYLVLEDADQNYVGYADTEGGRSLTISAIAPASGTYYVLVGAYELTVPAVSYDLSISFAPPTPPVAPTHFSATGVADAFVLLNWQDASTNETGFRILRAYGKSGGSFATIAELPGTDGPGTGRMQYYVDHGGLAPNKIYRYEVQAYNNAGDSPLVTSAPTATLAKNKTLQLFPSSVTISARKGPTVVTVHNPLQVPVFAYIGPRTQEPVLRGLDRGYGIDHTGLTYLYPGDSRFTFTYQPTTGAPKQESLDVEVDLPSIPGLITTIKVSGKK